MGLLTSISARNFMCYREETTIPLAQATYIAGANNSGKSTFLRALQCFFDSGKFLPENLNKTVVAARREGANRSDITVGFDLTLTSGKARQKRLIGKYGKTLQVSKAFTFREISRTIAVEYSLNKGKRQAYDSLDADAQALLEAVSVSYIHPQEGAELLRRAQDKFKERLFANWGRHASVATTISKVQADWDELRKTANQYLSAALTENVKKIWPGSETKVIGLLEIRTTC